VLGDFGEDHEIEGGVGMGEGPGQVHVAVDRDLVRRHRRRTIRRLVVVVAKVRAAHRAAVPSQRRGDLAATGREIQDVQVRVAGQPPGRAQDGVEDVRLRHGRPLSPDCS
jgi:hypothetical protein